MKLHAHYPDAHKPIGAQIVNWRENHLSEGLFYSHRCTHYDRKTYPSRLHYHDYYELVIMEGGSIRYICEDSTCTPTEWDVILIPPGKLHMSVINDDRTCYHRHVFYLYPNAFAAQGLDALTVFLQNRQAMAVASIPPGQTQTFSRLLETLDKALEQQNDPLEQALALGCTVQIFYMLNRLQFSYGSSSPRRPEKLLAIGRYLDENYTRIHSVEQVAQHFFYSREYVSRIFRRHYGTSVADYIRKRRIALSQKLIARGMPITEVSEQCGFETVSTFYRAFRRVTGMSPSAYRHKPIDKP